MDSLPLTAALLGKLFPIKGSEVERYYKHHLSDFDIWEQKVHAADWVLMAKNMGEHLSIDETQLCEEVYTILSNKAGHGGQGTVIAIVKGTKADVVSRIIEMVPESERARVTEITMDFSDSMYSIAKQCLPNATIVIDCFHIVKRLGEGLEEMRLRFKRLAQVENKKAAAAFAQNEARKAKNRQYYRRKHKRNPKETRGRKRIRNRSTGQRYFPMETPRWNCLHAHATCSHSRGTNGESTRRKEPVCFLTSIHRCGKATLSFPKSGTYSSEN